jgi:hypothetical protein
VVSSEFGAVNCELKRIGVPDARPAGQRPLEPERSPAGVGEKIG